MLRGFGKTILFGIIDLIIVGLIVMLLFVDIDLGPIKLSSINRITTLYKSVKAAEAEFDSDQKIYDAALDELETQKDKYTKEKNEYESISDDTINIIKEATAKENYSIEYMWIRLGNYAIDNDLSIILVEPGGGVSTQTTTTGSETQTTPVTSDDETPVQSASKEDDEIYEDNSDKILKIQVSGSYSDVSDFIFDVKNMIITK